MASALVNNPYEPATGPSDVYEQRQRRIRPGRVTGPQLQELYTNNKGEWEAQDTGLWYRIDECAFHLSGGSRFILPDAFLEGVERRSDMVVIFPQKVTTPLKLVALLGNQEVKVMRYPVGLGTTADETAVNVDTWLAPVLDYDLEGRKLVPFRDISGKLLLEGAVVLKVLSSDAHWRQSPTWLDTLDEDEYEALSPRRKRRYVPLEDVVDVDDEGEDDLPVWTTASKKVRAAQADRRRFVRVDREGVKVPRSRYHRDAHGRSRHDDYYRKGGEDGAGREFEEDRKASRKAFQRDQKDYLARRLPFEVEVISARHCVPLFDDMERVEAILVVRQYAVEDLLAKDLIFGDSLPLLVPAYETGSVTVYELWHTDERDRPYASYYVDGFDYTYLRHETEDGIELADAVIDLQKEYGCSRLPIRWFWGLNFPIDGVATKGVPFLWPILKSINAAEGIATANHVYAWRNAFAGNLIEISPAVLERFGDQLLKNSEALKFATGPMENAVVMGKPTPNVTPPPSAGSQQLLQMLLQSAASMSPSDAVFGGGGATSGHDRALSKEYLEIAMSQVLESARQAVAFCAEMILEYAVWIAEKTGQPVPVYANTETLQTQSGSKQRSEIIELLPSWLKSNTQVHAYYPETDADDLRRTQLAQQHMQGLVPWDQFRREAYNDPDPSATLAKVFADQVLRTPEGRQQVLARAQAKWGDESDQEKARLIREGLLSPQGVPTKARIPFITEADLDQLPGAQGAARPGAPPGAGSGLGASSAALPPGVVPPPGVPAALAARHYQLDASHAFARALEKPSGPLGPIGGPANAGGLPPIPGGPPPGLSAGMPGAAPVPGSAPGGPVGGPPIQLGPLTGNPPFVQRPDLHMPPGVEQAADQNPYPAQFAAAPPLASGVGGLGGPTRDQYALAGVLAGGLETAARRYHARRKAKGRAQKGPRSAA